MNYEAVGFDYGGVIEGKPGSFFNQMVCNTLNIDLTEYQTAYFSHNMSHNDGELITQDEMWKRILQQLQMPEKYDQLQTAIDSYKITNRTINEEVIAIIKSLRNQGVKVGLLTNNAVAVGERLRQQGTDALFDCFIVSAEVNLSKPDPAIFRLLADQLKVTIDKLVYVDDTEKSLSTATECGFTPVLFSTADDLTTQLSGLGFSI